MVRGVTDYIVVDWLLRLHCVGRGDRLYCSGGTTEMILWWRSDLDNIVVEGRLRLYCGGGTSETILWWRGE